MACLHPRDSVCCVDIPSNDEMAAAVAAAVAQDQEGNLLVDPTRAEEAVRRTALPTMHHDTHTHRHTLLTSMET